LHDYGHGMFIHEMPCYPGLGNGGGGGMFTMNPGFLLLLLAEAG
jgi:hypothetical protein